MTHREEGRMRFGLESDSWLRLLGTLERIAVALEKVAELAEQAAAHENLLCSADRTDAEVKKILSERNPPTGSADSPQR